MFDHVDCHSPSLTHARGRRTTRLFDDSDDSAQDSGKQAPAYQSKLAPELPVRLQPAPTLPEGRRSSCGREAFARTFCLGEAGEVRIARQAQA